MAGGLYPGLAARMTNAPLFLAFRISRALGVYPGAMMPSLTCGTCGT
jgi:hypothetical protein